MMLWLCAGAFLALLVLLGVLLIGWGGAFSLLQRAGLGLTAAGLVGASIPRLNGDPPGWGDVMFLAGLVTYFAATHGPALFHKLDGLDGAVDGRLRLERHRHDA